MRPDWAKLPGVVPAFTAAGFPPMVGNGKVESLVGKAVDIGILIMGICRIVNDGKITRLLGLGD